MFVLNVLEIVPFYNVISDACPGIRKGGGAQNLKAFFFLLFNFSGGGGQAQKIAEQMIFSTKKVAKIKKVSEIT